MDATTTATRTPAEWLALAEQYDGEAARCARQSAESFDRCDTDGFLSQWASDSTATLYRAKAEWARAYGKVTTRVLTDTDGVIVSTHHKDGQYGEFWVLDDAAAERFGRRFVSLSRAARYDRQAAANRRKGFVEAQAAVDGYVKNAGSGTGLSGALTVRPCDFPDIDALKAREVTITDPDFLATLSKMWDPAK